MSDQNQTSQEDLGAEFREIGEHLKAMLRAAWDRPERQQLQNEIELGLKELGTTLRQTVEEFSESEAGQRVRAEVDDFRGRVESGEVEQRIRKDLGQALRTVNAELQKVAEKLRTNEQTPPEQGE